MLKQLKNIVPGDMILDGWFSQWNNNVQEKTFISLVIQNIHDIDFSSRMYLLVLNPHGVRGYNIRENRLFDVVCSCDGT